MARKFSDEAFEAMDAEIRDTLREVGTSQAPPKPEGTQITNNHGGSAEVAGQTSIAQQVAEKYGAIPLNPGLKSRVFGGVAIHSTLEL